MDQSLTPKFWMANRVSLRSMDLVFRVTSASILSQAGRNRFLHGGIDAVQLAQTLRRVRGIRGWSVSWARTAHEYLGRARAAQQGDPSQLAGDNLANAALCFHFGQIFEHADLERKRRLYHRAAGLFRQAAPLLDPPAEPLDLPWRATALPGYLRRPAGEPAERLPLLVLLNGASTVKEETIRWAEPFLRRGFATLALDTPGSGEAWDRALGRPGQEDIVDALFRYVASRSDLDPARVAVLGISLRGALAVQLGAHDDRLAAVIAVTAPYHPKPYFRHLNRVVVEEIAFLTGMSGRQLADTVDQMSLVEVAPRVRAPLLVVGAGRDLIVPPTESVRLYEAASGPKKLLYLEDANHVGFSHMEEWTSQAADWLAETMRSAPLRPRLIENINN